MDTHLTEEGLFIERGEEKWREGRGGKKWREGRDGKKWRESRGGKKWREGREKGGTGWRGTVFTH